MDRGGRSLIHFLDKVKEWHFNNTSNEVIWPKKMSNSMHILAIFQTGPGWHGPALLLRPSRIPHRISKILFALGADEFLAMLDGKIGEGPYFYVSIL